VTEAEYLASTHLEGLYSFVKRQGPSARSAAGRRRFRLLACGSCRLLVWHQKAPEEARRAVEAAEAGADGRLKSAGLRAALGAAVATRPAWYWPFESSPKAPREALLAAAGHKPGTAVYHTARWALSTLHDPERSAARRQLCALLRDVFHYPLRPPSPPPAAVLKWDRGMVVKLAEAAYEQRAEPRGLLDAARLSVLADALEDAGCEDAEVVSHLRSPEPHVRGCWAVDLVRGRS
jgi:hypothetical protein